jgi:hypothetical protein
VDAHVIAEAKCDPVAGGDQVYVSSELVLARSNPLLVVAEEQVLVAEVPVENPSAGLVDVERNEVEDVPNDGSAREPPEPPRG